MALNAGKYYGLLSQANAPVSQNPTDATPLAGTKPASSFGFGNYEELNKLNEMLGFIPEKNRETVMQYLLVKELMNAVGKQFDEKWQEKQLEMADKAQTKKGWKSLMFNTLGSGLDNLTKGIAMSFNPYGTPEAARYAADMIANSGNSLANAFAATRTPFSIPAVQGGQAPTYF
jgi:hypothetical protein